MTQSSNNKVLIIDNKKLEYTESSEELFLCLSEQLKTLVQIESSLTNYLRYDSELIINEAELYKYAFVFIHTTMFKESILPVFLEEIAGKIEVVLFSGSKSLSSRPLKISFEREGAGQVFPNAKCYEISRQLMFKNFNNFLNSYLSLGEYKIEALYNSNYNPMKERAELLKRKIMIKLEISNEEAIGSEEFVELIALAKFNHKLNEIQSVYLKSHFNRIIERLEDLVSGIK
jgi:hypothetical protein